MSLGSTSQSDTTRRLEGRLARLVVVAVVFAGMWLLDHLTDLTNDDWSYHYFYASIQPSGSPRRLTGFVDVLHSIASHYRVMNGRCLAHTLLQSTTLLGKPWFDALNALMFVGVGQLVIRHMGVGRRRALPAAAVYATMFVLIPFFGQSVLWWAGAVNYLWMAGVTLLTLLPWTAPTSASRPTWVMVPVGLLAGLAGGSTNENSGGAWIVVALACMATWAVAGRRPPLWSWLGVLAAAAGLIIQLVSPGNRSRANRLGGVDLVGVVHRLPELWRVGMESAGWITLAFVAMLVVRVVLLRRIDAIAVRALVWALAGLLSGAAMIVSPFVPHRSFIWTVLFLMIGVGLLGRDLPVRPLRPLVAVTTAALVLVCAVVYTQAYTSIAQTHREVAVSLRQVEDAKAAGRLDVTVTKFRLTDNRWNALAWLPNLTADPHNLRNRWFSVYHGLHSVVVDNPDQVRR